MSVSLCRSSTARGVARHEVPRALCPDGVGMESRLVEKQGTAERQSHCVVHRQAGDHRAGISSGLTGLGFASMEAAYDMKIHDDGSQLAGSQYV